MKRLVIILLVSLLTVISLVACSSTPKNVGCNYTDALLNCEEERRLELLESGSFDSGVSTYCEEVVPQCN